MVDRKSINRINYSLTAFIAVVLFQLCGLSSYAQESFISLEDVKVDLPNCVFKIDSVLDKRELDNLGELRIKKLGRQKVNFQNPFEVELKKFFDNHVPSNNEYPPVKVVVYDLFITYNSTVDYYVCGSKAKFVFLIENEVFYIFEEEFDIRDKSTLENHKMNIIKALRTSLIKLNQRLLEGNSLNFLGSVKSLNSKETDTEDSTISTETFVRRKTTYDPFPRDTLKHVVTVGCLIGGYTLLGVNYERRLNRFLGVHGGLGVLGYEGGVKLHFTKHRMSHFLSYSFKDGGFGLLNTRGFDLGGTLIRLNKTKNLALHFQVGLHEITFIRESFRRFALSNQDAQFLLTFGLGVRL